MADKGLRVAMICHFSNSEVRKHLPLDNRKLYAFAKRLLRMPTKSKGYGDIAPWDTNLIAGFIERDDVNLHVISAHSGLKKKTISFAIDDVSYNFVRCDEATLLKRLIPIPKVWLNVNPMRGRVKRIVEKIKPDIVLLFGAENAYISSTILDLDSYPRMVMCQTIYNNPKRKEFSTVDEINAYVEKIIFSKNKYFSCISTMHRDLLLSMRPDAYVFHWSADTSYPEVKKISQKKYDFVNYAMGMTPKKGFPDVIEALAIVSKSYPSVKLNLVGGGSVEDKNSLMKLAERLGVSQNIVMTPFFEKQEDLFQHLQNSRFAVLPCKMDYIAGTMIQSMHYGLPLVVYETSGTPTLNSDGECVLIANNSNVKDLADKMLIMLDNPDKAEQMAERAKEFERRRTDRKKTVQEIVDVSRAVIDYVNNGVEIPKELIYK